MLRLALLVALATVIGACGGSSDTENLPVSVEASLLDRLESQRLSVVKITCVDSGHLYDGANVFRCNVNFGDPHIPAYCALLVDGELLTHFEEPDLTCDRQRTSEGEPVG